MCVYILNREFVCVFFLRGVGDRARGGCRKAAAGAEVPNRQR